jgi:hypothetical protein
MKREGEERAGDGILSGIPMSFLIDAPHHQGPLSSGWSRALYMEIVGMLCEKYNKSDVCPFGRASISANPFGGQKTLTFLFPHWAVLR